MLELGSKPKLDHTSRFKLELRITLILKHEFKFQIALNLSLDKPRLKAVLKVKTKFQAMNEQS